MTEIDPLVVFVITISTTIAAIIAANIYNSRSRKDRQAADKGVLEKETEKIAIEKKRDDVQTAKELKEHDRQMAFDLKSHAEDLAKDVKQQGTEELNNKFKFSEQEHLHQHLELSNKIRQLAEKLDELKDSLKEHIKSSENQNG